MNEFPKTFRLVFVYDGDTYSNRFFNFRPFLIVFKVLVLFPWTFLFHLLRFIQKCRVVCVWGKVDVTVRTFVVNLKAVVVVNIVAFMLISSMGTDLEKDLS